MPSFPRHQSFSQKATLCRHLTVNRTLLPAREQQKACQEVSFHDGDMDADEAVRTGCCSLRDVFRLWNIFDRDDLTIWLQGQGFAATQSGNHIPARVQEFVLSSACRVDARVALLEVVYVRAVLHTAQQMTVPRIRGPVRESHRQHPHPTRNATLPGNGWAELDDIDVEEVFLQRIPMLKSCPRFLRGRLRESFAWGLRERYRGKQEGDEIAERRGWKLFALVPTLLFHKPTGTGSVGGMSWPEEQMIWQPAGGRIYLLKLCGITEAGTRTVDRVSGGIETCPQCSSANQVRSSFQSKAHPHRSGSAPQDRRHIQFVAGQKTTATCEESPQERVFATRCQNVSATVRTGSGEGLCSIPVRTFHPSRCGLRRPCRQNSHGHGSPSDSAFD